MSGLAARELGRNHRCCSLATSLTRYMCMPSGSCKTARNDEDAGGERYTDCGPAKKSDELPPSPRLDHSAQQTRPGRLCERRGTVSDIN
jgi:hypothetical protein